MKRGILQIIFLIFISSFTLSQKCENDSLAIEKAIVAYINDTSIHCIETSIPMFYSDTVIVIDTIKCSPIDHKGEFNRSAPVMRILSLQDEIDSLDANKIIFRKTEFSVSCYNEELLYDFSNIGYFGGGVKFYEGDCQTIPFVKYYWEFDDLPGFINVTILTGNDNCFF